MPAQYRAIWTLPGGGTGYSVLHFTIAGTDAAAQQIADDVADFMGGFAASMPNDANISYDSEVLDLDDTGTLSAVWPVVPPTQFNGAGAGEYARASGCRIDWATGAIVDGRRLNGRTYMVPMLSEVFDVNGLLDAGFVGSVQTLASAFITATGSNRPLRVWSRTHSFSAVVQSASVPTQGAILRGRRD